MRYRIFWLLFLRLIQVFNKNNQNYKQMLFSNFLAKDIARMFFFLPPAFLVFITTNLPWRKSFNKNTISSTSPSFKESPTSIRRSCTLSMVCCHIHLITFWLTKYDLKTKNSTFRSNNVSNRNNNETSFTKNFIKYEPLIRQHQIQKLRMIFLAYSYIYSLNRNIRTR